VHVQFKDVINQRKSEA